MSDNEDRHGTAVEEIDDAKTKRISKKQRMHRKNPLQRSLTLDASNGSAWRVSPGTSAWSRTTASSSQKGSMLLERRTSPESSSRDLWCTTTPNSSE